MGAHVHVQVGFSDVREHSRQGRDMLELLGRSNQPGLTTTQGKKRTTAYPSFKYSLLKTSLLGSALGGRFRWGSGVDTFFSARTFLNSDVRLIDIFSRSECKPQDDMVEW